MAAEEKKNVHAGHRDRMRERMNREGMDAFEPHEVLEILLFQFVRVVNTNPTAHALIDRFGSVKNVLTAPYEELITVHGIGPKTAEGIRSIYPLMSAKICDAFRQSGHLSRYDLAFLADWFMDGLPNGSVGLVVCGNDRRFQDFVYVNFHPNDTVIDFGGQIVRAAYGRSYYLLIKEDFSLITREKAQMLRHITGCGHAAQLDVFVLEGFRPTSVYYMEG